ncbi:glutathione S-transferase N-terminal domain-containing protein [Synechococcus sp. RS9916]|uniref:glutathione S-transferase N-terminal domain-containing protein n=1 Tax=Synechococcus sp. RS9916 TaxID=221359 RepID=UPI0000E538CC|nr:glutathione S-transferase N-terminal domain-containing protein [Synechococcus sp. RS9916]EAU75215.1 putative maleylacetoacetate isomerase [Synechococcus sp. RS9916]
MASLQLYGCWRSSASHRLQIGLRLKQLPFEYRPVSLDEKEQHCDWYRALNPRGEVPTLVVDGSPWVQTLAILETLDERFADQGVPLLPRDAEQRQLCRAVAEQVNSSLQPLLLPARLRQPILKAAAPDGAPALAKALQAGVRAHQADALNALNSWLDALPGPFCLGSEPTLADACVVAQLGAAMRLGLDLNPFQRLSELHTHCLGHEAFAASAPEQQPDAPSQAPMR